MPNYGTLPLTGQGSGVAATVLSPGDRMLLFGTLVNGVVTGESPTAPQQSIAVARSSGPTGVPAGGVFTIQAASGTVLILGSNVDTPAQWALAETTPLYTATDQANAFYTDIGEFAYCSAKLSAGTGPVIVIMQR